MYVCGHILQGCVETLTNPLMVVYVCMCGQVLQDRVETLVKQIQDLESKAQSLQVTIDRLHGSLAKTEEEGHMSKDKVSSTLCSLCLFWTNPKIIYYVSNSV